MNYKQKQHWIFYTKDKDGNETVVGERKVIYPETCTLYKQIIQKGFVNGIYEYGFRLKND
jgi:hypothetical protein